MTVPNRVSLYFGGSRWELVIGFNVRGSLELRLDGVKGGGEVGMWGSPDQINPNPGPPHYLRQYKQKVLFIHSGFGFVLFRFALG